MRLRAHPVVIALGLVLGLWPSGWALAEGTLKGRVVTFRVVAYEDPAHPLFDGEGQTVRVSDAVEFGLRPEGPQNGLDVIPVQVNISDHRVEVRYDGPKEVHPLEAKFNGYVLSFDTQCVLFQGAKVDQAWSSVPVTDKDVTWNRNTLMINLSGQSYVTGSHFAVDLDVTDCPLS